MSNLGGRRSQDIKGGGGGTDKIWTDGPEERERELRRALFRESAFANQISDEEAHALEAEFIHKYNNLDGTKKKENMNLLVAYALRAIEDLASDLRCESPVLSVMMMTEDARVCINDFNKH